MAHQSSALKQDLVAQKQLQLLVQLDILIIKTSSTVSLIQMLMLKFTAGKVLFGLIQLIKDWQIVQQVLIMIISLTSLKITAPTKHQVVQLTYHNGQQLHKQVAVMIEHFCFSRPHVSFMKNLPLREEYLDYLSDALQSSFIFSQLSTSITSRPFNKTTTLTGMLRPLLLETILLSLILRRKLIKDGWIIIMMLRIQLLKLHNLKSICRMS